MGLPGNGCASTAPAMTASGSAHNMRRENSMIMIASAAA
jgi:hypothetical protein